MISDPDKTYIGIDYGERRIGLAKSDPTGLIASALVTLEVHSRKDALKQLQEQFAEHHPRALIVGYPLLASGDKSEKCRQIDRFVEELRSIYEGPIHLVDERHSSQEAASIIHAHGQKTGKDKRRIDRLAAVIILQRYLDEQTI
ncbi:MAG TPA: Holliday junction resolvase RuvX [candidate division Zixibacteria bacterium]|nr:Holliday junction resolvase RuvX [candidate division Zixibacteria bacterium]